MRDGEPRRGRQCRRRVLAGPYPRRGSGCGGGSPRESEAGAGGRHWTADGWGDDTPRRTGTSRGGGNNDDAGHSPDQTPVAAQAALEGARGSARPAPLPGSIWQKAGGDDTPRREGETGRMADETMTERAPPDRPRAPNAGGHGGDGTAQRTEGGDDTPRRESAEGRTVDEAMTERAPPERMRALNASGREGGEGRWGTPT